jgi:hypothetical protein
MFTALQLRRSRHLNNSGELIPGQTFKIKDKFIATIKYSRSFAIASYLAIYSYLPPGPLYKIEIVKEYIYIITIRQRLLAYV